MKNIWLTTAFVCMGLFGCQLEELNDCNDKDIIDTVEFYATIENDGLTKTSLDEHNNIRWSANDQIVIFKKTTLGSKYQVKDEFVGKTSGSFSQIPTSGSGDDYDTGFDLEHSIALYPYSETVECEKYESDYKLFLTLPSEQFFSPESFGNGSFPMAAVSETTDLSFQNICGGIKLQLKGTCKVASIKVEGKNGEKLSGNASLIVYTDEKAKPAITMVDDASTSVILNCGEGVQLNENEATGFIVSLPPTEFTKGFVVTVTDIYGGVFVKETSKENNIFRSSLLKMPEVVVNVEYEYVPDYQIWYSATKKVEINETADYGATIISHEWDKSTSNGIITFNCPVTSIGESAFYNQYTLTSISLPESIRSIGDKAFGKCTKLKKINIPASVTEMGKYVFEECNSLPVTDNIIYADTYLVKISNKSLYSVTGNMIKEGTRWIGEDAFYDYDNMSSIVIPEGVLKIGESAFSHCDNLSRVTIPGSLTSIGESAFYECRKITTVNITDLTAWCNINFAYCASPFSSYTTSRLVLNGNEVTDLIIPDGITSIGDYTFSNCSSLKSVTIPESVTSIGYAAFQSCKNLESVTVYGALTNMGGAVFSVCERLKSVTMHNGVTLIGKSAFQQCEALTDVILPSSVILIEDSAFSHCRSLTAVTIPEGLKSIGHNAFCNCTGITNLTLSNTVESIGNYAFYNCKSLKEVLCRPVDPPVLGTSVFESNALNRKIYVPSKAVDDYKTAGNWSEYANYIFSMSGDDIEYLSKDGTANCYIVSAAGSYKFSTVKGNSSESVGAVSSAEVLWETFGTDVTPNVGDLVKNVSYKNGEVTFQTADTFTRGNAVIAAKDASGAILWSWHIWLTDEPQGQEYYNNAGTMMDRNLGATSATPGDVGTLGLLYQWGRKDPFLGSSSISSDIEAKSTGTWPSAVSSNSTNGTIEYATAYPTTFIKYNSSNYDWYYTGSSTTDNTRWTTSTTTKSIYDPCPSGWRVPDGGNNGIWSKALGSSSYFEVLYDSTNEGMNFSGKFGSASTIWYPTSGFRNSNDGGLSYVGSGGNCWSASPGSSDAYDMFFNNYGNVAPSVSNGRADGQSVRCLQE